MFTARYYFHIILVCVTFNGRKKIYSYQKAIIYKDEATQKASEKSLSKCRKLFSHRPI